MNPTHTPGRAILAALLLASAFVAGRLTAPAKMPRAKHIWVGFDPVNRSAYFVNNENHLKIHGFHAACSTTGNGIRSWEVLFEEAE